MSKKYRTNQSLIDTGFRQTSGDTLTLCGNTTIGTTATLKYESDMSSTYTARSVVDAEYVTGITSGITRVGSNTQIIYRGVSNITGASKFNYFDAQPSLTFGSNNNTLSVNSAIIGGSNNVISTGNTNSVILGGDNLCFCGTGYSCFVGVPNLAIMTAPPNDVCLDYLLSWNDNTKQVTKLPYLQVGGLSCAINGLNVQNGNCASLGGPLIFDTSICGDNNYSLRFCDLCGICAITTSNNIVLDSRCCTGGIYMKSQCGAGGTATNFSDAVGISIDYQASHGFMIHDDRVGVLRRGIEYENSYSGTYSNRSLVDKEYVDSVAAGLNPKQAVQVATTVNIDLTGGTFVGIIDGVTVSDNDRALIKNQTDARQNGIYVFDSSGNTFTRATDFDEDSEALQGSSTFVITGTTWENTTWVLTTPNPIVIDTTELTFALFSIVTQFEEGHGIDITLVGGKNIISVTGTSLAGNSIIWSGVTGSGTFNVDIESGTLSTALDSKLDVSEFNGYTGTTQPVIDEALTGGTSVGSGVDVYSGQTGRTSVFRSIIGGGDTDVSASGDTIVINSVGGTYNLASPAAICVGGIDVGTVLTGKTSFELFEEILVPELCGTITAPSIGIVLTCSGIKEIGCNISQTVTGNFNQGCINPQYCSVSDKRSGLPNAYQFTGTGMPGPWQACSSLSASQNNASYDVISGSQSWGVCTRYDCGDPALGSKGTEYCAALPSGCTSAANGSITGILPWYWGTNASGTITSTVITGGTKVVAVVGQSTPITFEAITEYLWFAAPAGTTAKTKWWVCAANAGDIGGTGNLWAASCSVAVTSGQGCWVGCSFDVYVSCGITTTAAGIPMCLYY